MGWVRASSWNLESKAMCAAWQVREAVCILDLDVLFYPTPARGPTWRPKAKALGGKVHRFHVFVALLARSSS